MKGRFRPKADPSSVSALGSIAVTAGRTIEFAWRYITYDKPGEFTAAEDGARAHERGLWADPLPVPPWEWRKAKRQATKPH